MTKLGHVGRPTWSNPRRVPNWFNLLGLTQVGTLEGPTWLKLSWHIFVPTWSNLILIGEHELRAEEHFWQFGLTLYYNLC